MQTLNISAVDLPPELSRVFHSMLKIVEGRSVAQWHNSSSEEADVLVAHAGGNAALIERWGRSGKPMVMVVDERSSWAATPFKLHHPFRVMQLLTLLDELAMTVSLPRAPAFSLPSRDADGPWAAALRFHKSMAGASESSRYLATAESGENFWIQGGHAHALPDIFVLLRTHSLRWATFEPSDQSPPHDARTFAISDAGWYLGTAAPAGLAPWLDSRTAYRLARWPDLGRLGRSTGMMAMSATLASRACTATALAHDSGQPLQEAERLLNAASLAGLLSAEKPLPARGTAPARVTAPAPVSVPTRGWRRLVGELRRHLGMEA